MASKQVVILHTKVDWGAWIELKKTSALKHDIWKFVNPEFEESDIPSLQEPKRPTPKDIRSPSLKKYEKRNDALADLRINVQESKNISNIRFTYDCDTVYKMLRNLAAQFAPTDEIRNQEIELEWQALQTSWSRKIEVDKWLHKWEVTYNKMARIKSSDIAGLKPVYKFLNSVNTLDSQFAVS
ncbi:hypothetical protein Golomagni_01590 [Golovinomyces magnicellulatus]|nr:hypothetical protein Golomagni_01590 [Golovinomyces magnicellulatus]